MCLNLVSRIIVFKPYGEEDANEHIQGNCDVHAHLHAKGKDEDEHTMEANISVKRLRFLYVVAHWRYEEGVNRLDVLAKNAQNVKRAKNGQQNSCENITVKKAPTVFRLQLLVADRSQDHVDISKDSDEIESYNNAGNYDLIVCGGH